MSPGIGPCLVVLPGYNSNGDTTTTDGTRLLPTAETEPTTPGTASNLAPSPFIGMTPAEVAQRLGSPEFTFFVVLDARSAGDDTALLVSTNLELEYHEDVIDRANRVNSLPDDDDDDQGRRVAINDGVLTLRAVFSEAQSVPVALQIGCLGFRELLDIAANCPGGVLNSEFENLKRSSNVTEAEGDQPDAESARREDPGRLRL